MLLRLFPVVIACSLIAYFYYRKQERLAEDQKLYMESLQYKKYKMFSFWTAFLFSIGFVYVLYSEKYSPQTNKMESPKPQMKETTFKSREPGEFSVNNYFKGGEFVDDKPLLSRRH